MAIVRLCLIVVTFSVIVSCTGINIAEQEWAILRGEIVAGPTCPHHIDASECKTQPVESALLIVLDSEGQEVTRIKSDRSGEFSVRVKPGRYYLVPMPVPGLMGTPEQLEVTVDKMSSVPITIEYDTGIRSVTPPAF